MIFIKDADSYYAETEACKASIANTLSLPSPRYKNYYSEESNPFKSFFTSSPISPVISPRYLENEAVFDRLIQDSNRRFESKVKLKEYSMLKEKEQERKYTEKEEVYERLLTDTRVRKEKKEISEIFRVQEMERSLRSFRSDKTCTKKEAESIVKRLLYSTKKFNDRVFEVNRERDLTRFMSTGRLNTGENEISKDVKGFTSPKACYEKAEKSEMDIVERTEIEMMYGKPGRPVNPDDHWKTAKKKRSLIEKKNSGYLSSKK